MLRAGNACGKTCDSCHQSRRRTPETRSPTASGTAPRAQNLNNLILFSTSNSIIIPHFLDDIHHGDPYILAVRSLGPLLSVHGAHRCPEILHFFQDDARIITWFTVPICTGLYVTGVVVPTSTLDGADPAHTSGLPSEESFSPLFVYSWFCMRMSFYEQLAGLYGTLAASPPECVRAHPEKTKRNKGRQMETKTPGMFHEFSDNPRHRIRPDPEACGSRVSGPSWL